MSILCFARLTTAYPRHVWLDLFLEAPGTLKGPGPERRVESFHSNRHMAFPDAA